MKEIPRHKTIPVFLLSDADVRAGFEWGTTGRLSGQFNPPLLILLQWGTVSQSHNPSDRHRV